MSTWSSYLADNRERFLDELRAFVAIPSISALPEHADDVRQAATWVAERLTAAGIEAAAVLETTGHPVVYGEWLHAPGQPTILLYGHFDVQPADPYGLWASPPFTPQVRDGRLYGRGASDDKGNVLGVIAAVEALLQTEGALPVNVKFLFEGQEEIGSPDLPAFMAEQKTRFACDLVVSADGLQWGESQPALLTGLKGLCSLQIDVQGPASDLHSGLHGGVLQNPLHALAAIVASLRSPEGRILIDGFYDDVVPLSAMERAHLKAIPGDDATYMSELGVDALFGEPGYTTRERNWARPTLDVNGIWGGFQGEGTKTVIPAEAHAKITCRLVANQQPEEIIELVKAHVVVHAPPGVRVRVRPLPARAEPYLMAADHPGNVLAADVLTAMYGRSPYYMRLGGSIPVCPLFLQELGAYTVSFGFTLGDENLHAPNEFFRLASFDRVQEGYCRLLPRLRELP